VFEGLFRVIYDDDDYCYEKPRRFQRRIR
jgi:hypothetical protein